MMNKYIVIPLTYTVNTIVEEMDPVAPGPQDLSVLTIQEEHRSTPLWDV